MKEILEVIAFCLLIVLAFKGCGWIQNPEQLGRDIGAVKHGYQEATK